MSIRILLADSLTLMREGVRVLLEKEPGMEVVAEVEDGLAAVQLAQDISPDVVVIEIALPSLGGIGATRQIIDAVPDVKVVALSMYSDRQFVIGMLRAGASGYVLKKSASAQLVRAIKAVVAGQTYLSPEIAAFVVEDYVRRLEETDLSVFSTLSSRELEVLQLLAEGRDTQQIASRLEMNPKTVGTHRRSIMKKLGVHNVAGLIKYAIREGLTSP